MKKLFENWNKYLQEQSPTRIGVAYPQYKHSHAERPAPTPTVDELIGMWMDDESESRTALDPVMMDVNDLAQYLGPAEGEFDADAIKKEIVATGFPDAVHISVGRNGTAKVTHGENYLRVAQEMGLETVPTAINYQIQV
jgi:hypothetical protein|tara:strand:+ start:197 stop:613 length:417 start_codon:yes stop_codon:yes gene_type:complete